MNPLKPVRFYGRALPRPRYLEENDLSHARVDPPAPVNESLLRWAKDANWSMGGLSFKKLRMQGKIEGRLSKLKNYAEEEEEIPQKAGRKQKASPGKTSPDAALKKVSPKFMKRKGNSGAVKGRHSKGSLESPLLLKKLAAVHPLGQWGEEDGPTPRRVSPRQHASSTPLHQVSPLKPLSQPSPLGATVSNVSASIEFPVRRRLVERGLPDEDSGGEVNWEEFSLRDKPLRRSSRVTSVRRSFKEFTLASDSEHDA